MKQINKHILIFISCLSLLMMSCNKYLQENPITSYGPNLVFGSVDNAKQSLIGVYSQLAGDQGYGIRLSMYYTVDADDICGPTGAADNDRRDIARYSANANNLQLEKPWEQIFKGIEYANICILNIPKMSLYTSGTDAQKAELKRLYGEALTLRAQFYFEAVRNWGDVPAQWLPSSYQTNLFIARTDRDSIYNHVLDDLKTAEDLLPWRTEVTQLGDPLDERITKGAAKALRARIALFRGGYSLRVDSKSMKRGSDYLTYYKIAQQECADIIAQPTQHSLDPSFKDFWKNNVCAVTKIQDSYGEIVFQVAMSGGNSAAGDSKLGYYDGPRVNNGSALARGNGLFIVPTYFYSFDRNDLRRDVTCCPYNVNADGVTKTGIAITSMADGKYRSDWVTPAIPTNSTAQYFGINWIVIRFSDVLLMYAEADNEINNGPSAAAINALKQVRTRAFGGNANLIGTIPTDHDGFFNAVINERWWEFGGEGIRKYDLIRWNLLGSKLSDAKSALLSLSKFQAATVAPYSQGVPYSSLAQKMYYIKTATGDDSTIWSNSFYSPSPSSTPAGTTSVTFLSASNLDPTSGNVSYMGRFAQFFTANKGELLPIPQVTMDANYMLTGHQNPGY
jgi:SusD family.